MIQLVKIIILGMVQGITEFLPISSTAHLILLEKIFGISQKNFGLAFDTMLHLGTMFAVLWFFRNIWKNLFIAFINFLKIRKINTKDQKLLLLIIICTIPAGLIGLLLENVIEEYFRSEILIAIFLILFSIIFYFIDKSAKKNRTIISLNKFDSFVIGLSQAIALIPGVSRSGITIVTGMLKGLTREEAARFAFLISMPIILGAGTKKTFDVFKLINNNLLSVNDIFYYLIGMLTAFIFGYLTIKFFLKYISTKTLTPFIIYRIVLGIFILGIIFLK